MSNRNTSGSNSSNTDVVCCLSPAEIEEGTNIILEYMGIKRLPHTSLYANGLSVYEDKNSKNLYGEPKYHSSWNRLMPVIDKIDDSNFDVRIAQTVTSIHTRDKEFVGRGDTRIAGAFRAVVKFLKWYNHNVVSER